MSKYRKEVLSIFKQLHSTRRKIFQGDRPNLDKARAKINEEFKKNKNVQNEAEIPALISIAKDVEFFYRTQVVQAVEVEQGKHRLLITKDTEKLENVEYDDNAVIDLPRPPNRRCKK